jgi:predicted NUDIX family NTP pyrophosphohydrolase
MGSTSPGRVRVERGIYRQPNGKYAVCWRHAGRLRFRTIGFDVAEARPERLALIAATREGKVPVSPRLRFETVAGWWLERFEAKVAAGERPLLPRSNSEAFCRGRHCFVPAAWGERAFVSASPVSGL